MPAAPRQMLPALNMGRMMGLIARHQGRGPFTSTTACMAKRVAQPRVVCGVVLV